MLRKAYPSEIDTILDITKACGKKMASLGIYQWNEHYPDRKTLENDVKRGELYVMTSEESIVGCIVISTFQDQVYKPVKWLTADGNNYYIHRLAVHPDHQKKGYARKAMDFAEAQAVRNKGVSIRLDTFSKNLRNQRFYEARKYRRLEEIHFPKQSEYPFYCYELVL